MTRRALPGATDPCLMIKRRTSPKVKLDFQDSALEVLSASFKSQLRVNPPPSPQIPTPGSVSEPLTQVLLANHLAELPRHLTLSAESESTSVVGPGHPNDCRSKRLQPTVSRRRMLRRGSKCPSMFHGMDRFFRSSADWLETLK